MKSSFFTLLFTIFYRLVFSQIDTSYKQIVGTNYRIIIPSNFTASTKFMGFQDEEKVASIMYNEMPTPVSNLENAFTPAALKNQGMTWISKENIEMKSGKKATLLYVSQKMSGIVFYKHILIFGDDKKTVLLVGIFPEDYQELSQPIKMSLQSALYDENLNANPLDAVDFQVNTEGTTFKFAKSLSGALIYTTDGLLPTQSADSASIMISNSLSKIVVKDKKEYAIKRLTMIKEYENAKLVAIDSVLINGVEGYEIEAEIKNELVYFVMLFTKNEDYVLYFATATNHVAEHLASFKKIVRTLTLKH